MQNSGTEIYKECEITYTITPDKNQFSAFARILHVGNKAV